MKKSAPGPVKPAAGAELTSDGSFRRTGSDGARCKLHVQVYNFCTWLVRRNFVSYTVIINTNTHSQIDGSDAKNAKNQITTQKRFDRDKKADRDNVYQSSTYGQRKISWLPTRLYLEYTYNVAHHVRVSRFHVVLAELSTSPANKTSLELAQARD